MSNKTPEAKDAKIESARKYPVRIVLALVILVLVLIVSVRLFVYQNPPSPIVKSDPDTILVCFDHEQRDCVTAFIADTDPERTRGLSDTEFLLANQGMLFVFDSSSNECFWMKDMNFSIDMIFMDASKKVTKIYDNVDPDTYPSSFCNDQTKYVLEVNAGLARRAKLAEGQVIDF